MEGNTPRDDRSARLHYQSNNHEDLPENSSRTLTPDEVSMNDSIGPNLGSA